MAAASASTMPADVTFLLESLLASKSMSLQGAQELFDMRRDGPTARAWHAAVDGKSCVLTVMRVGDDSWFGCYTSVGLGEDEGSITDSDALLFTLRNPHGIPPTVYHVKPGQEGWSVRQDARSGPYFGPDMSIGAPFDETGSCTYFPMYYVDTTGKALSTFHEAGEEGVDSYGRRLRRNWSIADLYSFKMRPVPGSA